MKLNDLTDAEVLALTDDDVTQLIKRGMAEAGIPILPVPVEPEYDEVPPRDLKVYEVAGFMLTDRDAADKVQAAVAEVGSHLVKLGYSTDYNLRYVVKDGNVPEVTNLTVYSQKAYAEHKEVLERNGELRRDYESEKHEYEKADRLAADVRSEVTDRIKLVREKEARRVMLTSRYVEYIRVADGDQEKALAFLRLAFPMTDEEAAVVIQDPALATC